MNLGPEHLWRRITMIGFDRNETSRKIDFIAYRFSMIGLNNKSAFDQKKWMRDREILCKNKFESFVKNLIETR